MKKTEQYLNFNETMQVFSLDNEPKRMKGWKTLACTEGRTAIAFTDFIRYQFFDRKIHLTTTEAEHTLSNLRQFVEFYKDYVLDQSFEITDEKTGQILEITEIL